MARETTKIVRFYDPVEVNQTGVSNEFSAGFWQGLEKVMTPLDTTARTTRFNQADYFGLAKSSKTPAARYFKIGRQRQRADEPEILDTSSGTEIPLALPADQKLYEPSFLLPFGTKNRVAILAQSFSSPRVSALENWLTQILGYGPTDKSVALRPVIDQQLAQKLHDAVGATVLEVAFPRGSQTFNLPGRKTPGTVRNAIVEAAKSTDEAGAGLRWSFGHSKVNLPKAKELLKVARELRRHDSKLDVLRVNLQIPLADGGIRSEHINLMEEKITANATYTVPDDAPPEDSSVLAGMYSAIEVFNAKV